MRNERLPCVVEKMLAQAWDDPCLFHLCVKVLEASQMLLINRIVLDGYKQDKQEFVNNQFIETTLNLDELMHTTYIHETTGTYHS
jgi:hypothetical protein